MRQHSQIVCVCVCVCDVQLPGLVVFDLLEPRYRIPSPVSDPHLLSPRCAVTVVQMGGNSLRVLQSEQEQRVFKNKLDIWEHRRHKYTQVRAHHPHALPFCFLVQLSHLAAAVCCFAFAPWPFRVLSQS